MSKGTLRDVFRISLLNIQIQNSKKSKISKSHSGIFYLTRDDGVRHEEVRVGFRVDELFAPFPIHALDDPLVDALDTVEAPMYDLPPHAISNSKKMDKK